MCEKLNKIILTFYCLIQSKRVKAHFLAFASSHKVVLGGQLVGEDVSHHPPDDLSRRRPPITAEQVDLQMYTMHEN